MLRLLDDAFHVIVFAFGILLLSFLCRRTIFASFDLGFFASEKRVKRTRAVFADHRRLL
jgi:hypothetical protein